MDNDSEESELQLARTPMKFRDPDSFVTFGRCGKYSMENVLAWSSFLIQIIVGSTSNWR